MRKFYEAWFRQCLLAFIHEHAITAKEYHQLDTVLRYSCFRHYMLAHGVTPTAAMYREHSRRVWRMLEES